MNADFGSSLADLLQIGTLLLFVFATYSTYLTLYVLTSIVIVSELKRLELISADTRAYLKNLLLVCFVSVCV